jgi:hypothetical protein
MFLNQDSTFVLKAKLANAVVASQLEISVTYKDNTDTYHADKVVQTTGTTAVTLLDEPSSGVVNLVELIKIYNPDTQSNTVQILANDTVIFTCTVGANQSAILSESGISNGLGYTPANADLSNLTSTGKKTSSRLSKPSGTFVDLTLPATESSYTAPANGRLHLAKYSTAVGQYVGLYSLTSAYASPNAYSPGVGYVMQTTIDCKKDDQILIQYTAVGSTFRYRFIYDEGEV